MAKIPSLQEPTISREVGRTPTQSLQSAGRPGEAIQRFGQALGQAGEQAVGLFSDLEKRRKKAEIVEFGDNRSRKYRMEVNRFINEEKANTFGTDHRGFRQRVDERIQSLEKEVRAEAPSPEAADFFTKKVRAYNDSRVIDSDSYENAKRAEFYVNDRVQSVQNAAINFFDNPNPFEAAKDLESLQVELSVNDNFDVRMRESLIKTAQSEYRKSVFDGMLRDDLPGIIDPNMTKEQKLASVDTFVSGQIDGTESLFAGISPNEVKQMKMRAASLIEKQESARNSETELMIRNASNLMTSQTSLSRGMNSQINNAFSRLNSFPEGPKKDILVAEMVNAKKVNEFLKQSVYMSNSELAQIDTSDIIKENNLITAGVEKSAHASIIQASENMVKERNSDGAEWIQKHFPAHGANISSSLEMQKKLGIPNPRVMSKDESMTASRGILEGLNPRDKALELDRFLAQNGEFAPQAMSELIQDNKEMGEEYMVASYLNSTISKESIIGNIGKKKEITKEFKDVFGVDSTLRSDIQSEMGEAAQVFAKAGIPQLTNGFREAILVESKRLMLQDSSLSTEDAAKDATTRVLHENFDTLTDGKSSMIIPKELGVSKRTVDAFLDGSLHPEALQEYGIDKDRYAFAGTQEEFSTLVSDNGFWTSNQAQDGIILHYTNPRTGISGKISDNNGRPVEIKYKDMRTNQRALNNLNSIFSAGARKFLGQARKLGPGFTGGF